MNLYGLNNTLFDLDLGYSDAALIESISSSHLIADRRYTEREEENLLKLSNSILMNIKRNDSPPKRRHDGTSPLPLGMDWSPPPRNWDGPNTIWPHDFHTGWSYCVTVPSWNLYAESRGSEPVVFYRVQIGLQSPEGVTITHEVLRRFSDFLKLYSDLKRSFRNKKLPPGPPKGLLRTKNRSLLEERRCSLEAWMEKALSDIDISRSAPVACFLELEAAARSSFRESSQNSPKGTNSDTPSKILNSCDVHQDGGTSSKCVESDEISEALDTHTPSDLQILTDTRVVFPLDEQKKMNSLLSTMDVENLMARSYQENEALHQELESTKEQLKNLQKCQEEADLKSKSDIKLLVKEVKSVRRSQSELQQELDRVLKEKMDFETRLEKERTERESVDAANRKLMCECEILRGHLEECSVNFLDEQEKKLKMEFPADALDILATSENRIDLLLEEAQLLAQDMAAPDACSSHDRLRKMVADVLFENAILRKRENCLFRCAFNTNTYETSSISLNNSSEAIKEPLEKN